MHSVQREQRKNTREGERRRQRETEEGRKKKEKQNAREREGEPLGSTCARCSMKSAIR